MVFDTGKQYDMSLVLLSGAYVSIISLLQSSLSWSLLCYSEKKPIHFLQDVC